MTHGHFNEPPTDTRHWESDSLKPMLDEHADALNVIEAGGAVPNITATPTTTLTWDGTNGGVPDAYGRVGVNTAQWTVELGGGETPVGSGNRWGNNELQIYVNDRDRLWVKGGQLHIKAMRGSFTSPVAGEVPASYASARIHTQGKVTTAANSYWEVQVQHPSVRGAWGAVWQMGTGYIRNADNSANWPQFGEIDVEWEGHHSRNVGFALHALATGYTPPANDVNGYQHHAMIGHDKYGHVPRLPRATDYPHTIGLWRSATEVRWYVNRRQVDSDTQAAATAAGMQWPFGGSQFFVVNLAVGGQLGGSDLDGRDVDLSSMGAEMVLDAIQIWSGVADPATLGLL